MPGQRPGMGEKPDNELRRQARRAALSCCRRSLHLLLRLPAAAYLGFRAQRRCCTAHSSACHFWRRYLLPLRWAFVAGESCAMGNHRRLARRYFVRPASNAVLLHDVSATFICSRLRHCWLSPFGAPLLPTRFQKNGKSNTTCALLIDKEPVALRFAPRHPASITPSRKATRDFIAKESDDVHARCIRTRSI